LDFSIIFFFFFFSFFFKWEARLNSSLFFFRGSNPLFWSSLFPYSRFSETCSHTPTIPVFLFLHTPFLPALYRSPTFSSTSRAPYGDNARFFFQKTSAPFYVHSSCPLVPTMVVFFCDHPFPMSACLFSALARLARCTCRFCPSP